MIDVAEDVNNILQTANGRRELLGEVRAALASGAIYLVYQPKLHLRTGEVRSVEALIRWDHPRFGSIAPPRLIELVESAGYVAALTFWVIRRAMDDQRQLTQAGRSLVVYVNVSASLLSDGPFIDELCAMGAVAADKIGLEVTETAIIQHYEIAVGNLNRLRALGFPISIDDYGSGLSSLAYLKDMPATELKIDRQFISGMAASHRDPLIVRSTIDLAHALGMKVVAEGVESLATLALLRVMGCDYAQGFLISVPLRIAVLAERLETDDHRALLDGAGSTLRPPDAFWARTALKSAPSSSEKETAS